MAFPGDACSAGTTLQRRHRCALPVENVSAALALPYHAMITHTRLVTPMLMHLP
ncbi:hypothetical protein [Xanthomonas theicola]|uniref:hypothetical protein n=1 Tax=Xanthomonas theicola TaxID=56464 RepID=UPI001304BC2D|nr:hypothetical protein [Xanthomonas theicola]